MSMKLTADDAEPLGPVECLAVEGHEAGLHVEGLDRPDARDGLHRDGTGLGGAQWGHSGGTRGGSATLSDTCNGRRSTAPRWHRPMGDHRGGTRGFSKHTRHIGGASERFWAGPPLSPNPFLIKNLIPKGFRTNWSKNPLPTTTPALLPWPRAPGSCPCSSSAPSSATTRHQNQ